MDKLTAKAVEDRVVLESKTSLDYLVREGVRRMLQEALENEVTECLARLVSERTKDGRQAIVRNGHLPARDLLTGAGSVRIRQTRVRDQRRELKFTSRILPPYLRRVPSTVRHRQRQTKGCGSRLATLTMVFKLAKEAERQRHDI